MCLCVWFISWPKVQPQTYAPQLETLQMLNSSSGTAAKHAQMPVHTHTLTRCRLQLLTHAHTHTCMHMHSCTLQTSAAYTCTRTYIHAHALLYAADFNLIRWNSNQFLEEGLEAGKEYKVRARVWFFLLFGSWRLLAWHGCRGRLEAGTEHEVRGSLLVLTILWRLVVTDQSSQKRHRIDGGYDKMQCQF